MLRRFLKWLSHQASPEVASPLDHKRFAILGLGSSCYPRFCAAADMFESMLLAAGEGPTLGQPQTLVSLHATARLSVSTLKLTNAPPVLGRSHSAGPCTQASLPSSAVLSRGSSSGGCMWLCHR